VRSFVHADWQDGEDVVSAEGAGGDEGFNARFHKIEGDLDALSHDNARMFECMAELRADLAILLEEVRSELNRINADLHALRPSAGDTTLPPITFPRDRFDLPAKITPPVGPGPVVGPVNPWGPFINPGNYTTVPGTYTTLPAEMLGNPGTVWTPRDDATVGLIGGMRATRITEGMFNGARVELWNTPLGTVITPVAAAGVTGLQGYVDPRLEMTGRVGAWSVANEAAVTEKFQGNAFTKADLEREFGAVDIGGGIKLTEAIKGVDAEENFASLGAVLDRVAEVQAGVIVDSGAATVATLGSVGLNLGETAPAAASVDVFAAATAAERTALGAAGFKTVEDLATASPAKLAQALEPSGLSVDNARAAAGRLQGIALAVGRLGR
jgi:hypothetical protein